MRDTKEREREMRDLSVLCPSSFGRLFVLWSTFSVFTFFRFSGGEEMKKHQRKKFCSFLVSLFFILLLFLHQNKLRVCSTHEHNTKRRDEIRTQRVVVRK